MNHRRRTEATQATVSLFPFLAVLLCTMGALLVLLVVMARQARFRAARERMEAKGEETLNPQAADLSAELADRDAELAKLRERTVKMTKMQGEGKTRLDEAQLRLGHAETHLRQLADQLASFYATAEKLAALDETRFIDRQDAEEELARLDAMIREAEADVAAARKEAAGRPKSYAIVPYQGPNGTHRRPIYIECREDAIVLQPEGIELPADDFRDPIGPGNPLAAALRAARDYHTTRLADPNESGAQPYPLVLVRPSGILAYYHARKAIASWGPDFGYELIDGDWTLDLPAADPQLAHLLYRAVETARARQRALALAAPRRFRENGSGGTQARNAAGGGGSRFTVDVDQLPGDGSGQPPGGSEPWTADSGQETGDSSRDLTGRRMIGSQRSTGDWGQGTGDGGQGTGDEGQAPRQALGDSSRDLTGRRSIDSQRSAGDPGDDPTGSRFSVAADAGRLSSSRPLQRGEPNGAEMAGNSSGAGSSSRGTPGGSSSFASGASSSASQMSDAAVPDWPKSEPSPGAVPIRRAIHVVVRRDRLAILPEQGVGGGSVVPVDGDVDASLAELAVAMREHMRGWGIAGRGLYWKPILVLKATPDGAANAAHLVRRLQGSGIEIRTPGATIR